MQAYIIGCKPKRSDGSTEQIPQVAVGLVEELPFECSLRADMDINLDILLRVVGIGDDKRGGGRAAVSECSHCT